MEERNDWRVVEQAPPPYAKCIVSGFTDGPFVDFGVRAHAIEPNVLLNVSVLKDAAKFVGMVDGETHAETLAALAEAEAQVELLDGELNEAQTLVDSIDAIESAGFRARKKPGRKPQPVG